MKNEDIKLKSRLLIFDDQLLHREGGNHFGTDSRILFLAGLKEQFKSVHLFCRVKEVSDKHINESFIISKEVKVHEVYYPLHFLASFFQYFFYLPALIKQMKKVCGKNDYLCLTWPHPVSFLIWIASRGWKHSPRVIFLARQNAYAHMAHATYGKNSNLKKKLLSWMESALVRKGRKELVLAVGRKMLDRYKFTHPNTKLIHFPRISEKDIENYKSGATNDHLKLLYVCEYNDTGLDNLVHSVESMLKIGVPVKLDIIGKCRDLFGMQQLVIKCKLTDHVRFHPEVTHTNGLYKFYSESDLLAVPHIKDTLPKSVYEAMSFGLPVIAPQSQIVADILTHNDNAWLFKSNDMCSMVDGVYYLYKNRKFRDELGTNFGAIGKQHTLEFQQNVFVQAILDHDISNPIEDAQVVTGRVVPMPEPRSEQGMSDGVRKRMQWLMRIF